LIHFYKRSTKGALTNDKAIENSPIIVETKNSFLCWIQ